MAGMTYTIFDAMSMSTAEIYGRALVELGRDNPNIVALSADLAKSTKIGAFADAYPDRFFNVGIAEQNLFGVAAGLARVGFTPYVSTFAAFASMRALDQVHSDICYQNLNVKIIATHAGLSFGQAGSTHNATEDLAIMRSMANLVVVCPADGLATAQAVAAADEHTGPVYIRINRGFDQVVYSEPVADFAFGKAVTLREGTDLTIIATGSGVWRAVQAADMLRATDGLSIRVLDMHTIKPLDSEAVAAAVRETRRVITVEDHNVIGGLGSAVAEVAAGVGKGFAFKRLGVPDVFGPIGQPEDLFAMHGYDENAIAGAARELLRVEIEEDDDWDDEF